MLLSNCLNMHALGDASYSSIILVKVRGSLPENGSLQQYDYDEEGMRGVIGVGVRESLYLTTLKFMALIGAAFTHFLETFHSHNLLVQASG